MSALAIDFADQQSKLSRVLGDANTSTDDMWVLADRKFEINRGEVQFSIDTKSLLRKVTGTVASQKIDLPSGFQGIHVLIVDEIALTNDHEVPLADYERFVDGGDESYYFWTDTSATRQINFLDTSANGLAYILYYFAKPTSLLTLDADLSPFQEEYKYASVYYAAGELLPMAGLTQLAAFYGGKYQEMVARSRTETEKLVKSVIKAMPDLAPNTLFDKDKQGVGSFPGPGFNL